MVPIVSVTCSGRTSLGLGRYRLANLRVMNITNQQGDAPQYELEHQRRRVAVREWSANLLESRSSEEVIRELESRVARLETDALFARSADAPPLKQRLAASEERYRHLFNAASDSVFIVAAEGPAIGMILDVNEAAVREHGYSREELLTMKISELDTPETGREVPERLQKLLCEGSLCFEVEHQRKDGSIFPVEVSAWLTELNGLRCAVAFNRDISLRKRVSSIEVEQRLRLQLAAKAGNIGFWDWNILTNQVFYSPEWKKQLGYEDGEIGSQFSEWESRVHPEDLEKSLKFLREYLGCCHADYAMEFRLRHKDGGYRWIFSQGSVLRDSDGTPMRMLGCHVDVTHRKQAEEHYLDIQERFRTLVLASAEIVWTTDAAGKAQEDTPSWRAFTGQTLEQLKDFGWLNVIHPADRELTAQRWQKAVTTPCPIEIEYRLFHHESQEWRWMLVRGLPLKRADGSVRLWIGMNKDITERKKAEAALQLARFSLDKATLAIFWVRQDSTFADVNEAACSALGYTREELLKLRVSDIDVKFPLDQWPAYWAELKRKKHINFTSREKRKNGTEFDVEINANWMTFAGEELNCAFVQDISSRLQTESEFKREAERIKAIYSTEPECIKTVALEGQLLEMNPAGLRLIEADCLQQVVGLSVFNLIHPEDLAAYKELHKKVSHGDSGTLEFRIVGLKGTHRWMETHAVPLRDDNGRIGSVLSVTRDVTSRRQAEADRRFLATQLQQAQKMDAIGTLAGGIAHDFNNILGAIMGYLDLARMDANEGLPVEDSLTEIRKAADRAKSLVRQILTFSRQEPHEHDVVDLAAIVSEATRFLRSTISTVVSIEVSIDPSPPPVLADANQIHQVLVNLCTNAFHALDDRPGTIRIHLSSVQLDPEEASRIEGLSAGEYSCLTVTDNGKGMDEATLQRIFEPFFTTKKTGQGTGLGLSVVHGIVHSHRGAISVTSKPGEGSAFRVYLPAAAARSRLPMPAETPVEGRGQRVLVLDDDLPLNRVTSRTLERLGYQVTSCDAPRQAVDAIRDNPTRFHVVITDYELPGMSGLDVAAEMLAINPEIRILMCSGYLKCETRDQAMALGIRRILPKPCEVGTLSRTLSELMSDSVSA